MILEKANSHHGLPSAPSQFIPHGEEKKERTDSETVIAPAVLGVADGGIMLKLEEVLRELKEVRQEIGEIKEELAIQKSLDEGETNKVL